MGRLAVKGRGAGHDDWSAHRGIRQCSLVAFRSATRRRELERLEICHEIGDLSLRELEQWHLRVDSFSQGPLQVLNWIFEMQSPEGGRGRERTFADCLDGMTLRAMQESKPQTSPLRRRLCQRGLTYTQQKCSQRDDEP
jgi:hypothetical protein